MKDYINVIGGGLAGTEAAYQISKRGIKVKLYEMKPKKYSPAHSNSDLAEIVCSNSFKSNLHTNACGLLKEELRILDSLLIKIADETAVPAGQALAVDREKFAEEVTKRIENMNNIEIIRQEVGNSFVDNTDDIIIRENITSELKQMAKDGIVIIATGPLTSDKLFKEILSDKKEAVKFINHYLNLCLVESDIEKYEKEFRTNGFYNIEADIVYKLKEKNVFILIEHQSSVDLKMAYRVLCYKDAIIESAIDKKRLKERNYKIPKVIAIVLYTGKRKWNSLSINDIEERIDGYENPNNEYHLIDSNEFSRNKLLSDNLITSKAMLIEKSKNKDELYKNIEDVIHNQIRNNTFDNTQLEKLVRYELAETEDNNIISKFLEKIRNIEGSEEIMTNASRIINREIRKERKAGLEQGIQQGLRQGIALVAKKLKGKMEIKDISQITGLSEAEIENL